MLALGIGANTTVFTLVNAILLKPLPVAKPDQLVRIYELSPQGTSRQRLSYPDYRDYRDSASSFSGIAGVALMPFRIETESGTEEILGEAVTGNYFEVLGISVTPGRGILAADDDPGSDPVAVISHRLWLKNFNGDNSALQKTMKLNGRHYRIAGVMQSDFNGTYAGARIDCWVTLNASSRMLGMNWNTDRAIPAVHVVGRIIKASPEQAQAELNTIANRLAQSYPDTNRGKRIQLVSATLLHGNLRKGASIFFTAFMALMGLTLLITCSNLAGLLITKALQRKREIAIRLSLGADRKHLVYQLLTESLLMSTLGGIAGLFLSIWSGGLIISFWPIPSVPVHFDFTLDGNVLLFVFFTTLLTGVLLGIAPVLQSRNTDVVSALKEDAATSSLRKTRLKNALVALQICLSVVVLICAALFIRSWHFAQSGNPGFNPENMAAMDIDLKSRGFSNEQGLRYYAHLQERVAGLPGIESVTLSDLAPVDIATSREEAGIDGHQPPPESGPLLISSNRIAANYFRTTGIPLLRGREFTYQDHDTTPTVVIVNETFAQRFWRGQYPVGKSFTVGKDQKRVTVIGVARDSKYRTPGEESTAHMYLSYQQFYEPGMTLLLRATTNPGAAIKLVRDEMEKIDPGIHAFFARTMKEHLAFSLLPSKLGGSFLTAFGLLGLLLASIGIYAAVSFHATQRIREVGIRMAVGATQLEILGMFVRHGLRLSLIGIGAGILVSLALTRLLSALLSGVSPTDPIAFALVPLFLVLVSLASCILPARKASMMNPLRALRYE